MKEYNVTWKVDIDGYTPWNAAYKAREMQKRPDSIATIFVVDDGEQTWEVDLTEGTQRLVGETESRRGE